MKYFISILLTLCIYCNSQAQAPQGIPYQSVMRNGSGVLLANQSVHIRFSIHDSTAMGNIVYQETHATTTNSLGMVALTIGQGTPVTGTFSNIHWGNGAKFMQVELDTTAGNNYIDLGTQPLMSVPYALYADESGSNDVNIPNPKMLAGSFNKNGTIQMGSGYTVSKNGSEYTITFNDTFASTPVLQGNLVGYTDLKSATTGDYKITESNNKLIRINTGNMTKSSRSPIIISESGDWLMAKSKGWKTFGLKNDSTLWFVQGLVNVNFIGTHIISNNKFSNFILGEQSNIALSIDSTLWEFNDSMAYQISNLKWKQIVKINYKTILLSSQGTIWELHTNGNLVLVNSGLWNSISQFDQAFQYLSMIKSDNTAWSLDLGISSPIPIQVSQQNNFTQIFTYEISGQNIYSLLISQDSLLWQSFPNYQSLLNNNSIVYKNSGIYKVDSINKYVRILFLTYSGTQPSGILINADSTFTIFGYDNEYWGRFETTFPYIHNINIENIKKVKFISFSVSETYLTTVSNDGNIYFLNKSLQENNMFLNNTGKMQVNNENNELIPGDNFNTFNFIIIGSK